MAASNEPDPEMVAAAHDGDVEAQIYLGCSYAYGNKSYKKDELKAQFWLSNASLSSIEGKRCFARFLCSQELPEALPLINELVYDNDTFGQYLLGNCYLYGICGAPKDKLAALDFFMKAAFQGHLVSQIVYERHRPTRGFFDYFYKKIQLVALGIKLIFLGIKNGTDTPELRI